MTKEAQRHKYYTKSNNGNFVLYASAVYVGMRYLVLLIFLALLTGCYNIRAPLGAYGFDETGQAPSEEHKEKEKTGMSTTVATLLGIGSGVMLMSMVASTYDDQDSVVAAVATGSTGLVFWGAAGVVAVAE